MDLRVDFNVEAAVGHSKDRDFVKEVDDFYFGGYVDWIRRDETGCYVYIQDAWIPVVDWMKKYEFPGKEADLPADLAALAGYGKGFEDGVNAVLDSMDDKYNHK